MTLPNNRFLSFLGAAFDGGEGLDPLISAYAVILTGNRRFLLAVNAGSDSISVFRVRNNLSLRLVDQKTVHGVGPNSVAYRDGYVYVSTIDSDGVFNGEPDQEGALTGFRLTPQGRLQRMNRSVRELENRPSAVQFSPDGSPPAFAALQTGSVSTWHLGKHGQLTPVNLDVITGNDQFDGERTACWIEFSKDQNTFWVSNALESTLSAYAFSQGQVSLIERVEAEGVGPADGDPFGTTDGWIDLWASDDGKYVHQLYGLDGTIGVFKVDDDGFGAGLTLIQEVSDLPDANTQGIVAF